MKSDRMANGRKQMRVSRKLERKLRELARKELEKAA